jgi:hypothetical protein
MPRRAPSRRSRYASLRPRGSKWKSDTSANRILECAVAAGSKFVVTGDEHGAGRSDALIEEGQNRRWQVRDGRGGSVSRGWRGGRDGWDLRWDQYWD